MHIERCTAGKPYAFIICTVYHIRANGICTAASLSSPALRPFHLPFPALRPSSLPPPSFSFALCLSPTACHRNPRLPSLSFSLSPSLSPPSARPISLSSPSRLSLSLPFSLSFPPLRQHRGDGRCGDVGGYRKKWVQGSGRWVDGGIGREQGERRKERQRVIFVMC
ncbi:hypothetical protein AAC387_Pa03g2803 [Persea americana]